MADQTDINAIAELVLDLNWKMTAVEKEVKELKHRLERFREQADVQLTRQAESIEDLFKSVSALEDLFAGPTPTIGGTSEDVVMEAEEAVVTTSPPTTTPTTTPSTTTSSATNVTELFWSLSKEGFPQLQYKEEAEESRRYWTLEKMKEMEDGKAARIFDKTMKQLTDHVLDKKDITAFRWPAEILQRQSKKNEEVISNNVKEKSPTVFNPVTGSPIYFTNRYSGPKTPEEPSESEVLRMQLQAQQQLIKEAKEKLVKDQEKLEEDRRKLDRRQKEKKHHHDGSPKKRQKIDMSKTLPVTDRDRDEPRHTFPSKKHPNRSEQSGSTTQNSRRRNHSRQRQHSSNYFRPDSRQGYNRSRNDQDVFVPYIGNPSISVTTDRHGRVIESVTARNDRLDYQMPTTSRADVPRHSQSDVELNHMANLFGTARLGVQPPNPYSGLGSDVLQKILDASAQRRREQ